MAAEPAAADCQNRCTGSMSECSTDKTPLPTAGIENRRTAGSLPPFVILLALPCPSKACSLAAHASAATLLASNGSIEFANQEAVAAAETIALPGTTSQAGIAVPTLVGSGTEEVQEEEESKIQCVTSEGCGAERMLLTRSVAARIPYVVSALSMDWRRPSTSEEEQAPVVQVFLPAGCPCSVLRTLLGRLATDADGLAITETGLSVQWFPTNVLAAVRLVQVASMLQVEEVMPELVNLVRDAVTATGDYAALEAACRELELPAELRQVAACLRPPLESIGLPNEAQVDGMIASALLTADGKVWRVVQKVIDRREVWPHLAKENAGILLAFATGVHGSIRATPHTGFFWGSRDFLYLVCRYIRRRSEHFDAMVSAMFDSVYNMDPELPAEIIDAVFKELLVHEGLSLTQCEHVIAKLMQQENQLEYLFHEWSGVFPALPANARHALSKGLLPAIGCCPHAALDFVLKELDSVPPPSGRTAVGLRGFTRVLLKFTQQQIFRRGDQRGNVGGEASDGRQCLWMLAATIVPASAAAAMAAYVLLVVATMTAGGT